MNPLWGLKHCKFGYNYFISPNLSIMPTLSSQDLVLGYLCSIKLQKYGVILMNSSLFLAKLSVKKRILVFYLVKIIC
jgi:hypothetical protein